MPRASLLRSSSRSSKRSAVRRKKQGPKQLFHKRWSPPLLRKVMIALASASATCVRALLGLRALICVPFIFSCFPLLDFVGTAIDAVTINSRARVGIAAAFGVVDFTKHELKMASCCLFGAVRDAIQ